LSPSEPVSRDDLESLVGAMAAAGLVLVEDTSFEKAGRVIAYRKVTLTREGLNLNERTPLDLLLATNRAEEWQPPKRKRRKSPERKQPAAGTFSVEQAAPKKRPPEKPQRGPESFSPQEAELEKRLRDWRNAEARKSGLPAYCMFSDQALYGIVQARPAKTSELLEINGIGPAKAEKYGQNILRICHSLPGKTPSPTQDI